MKVVPTSDVSMHQQIHCQPGPSTVHGTAPSGNVCKTDWSLSPCQGQCKISKFRRQLYIAQHIADQPQ